MKPTYRRILIFVIALFIIGGGYVVYRFVAAQRNSVPQQFSEARTQGGLLSEKIVGESNEVAFAIAHIDQNSGNYAQASSTISEVLGKVADIRSQAIELSARLGTMTQALPEIRNADAREAALRSISQRLALISNLISYTDKVTQLAELLRLRLRDHAENTKDIGRLIMDINAQVTAINNFNRAANESMQKFDSLLR